MSGGHQYLASYTLSRAKDDRFSSNVADVYGFSRVVSYGSADRRHRLVVSGILQLPYEMQVSAIGDFRSSLPFNPSSPFDLDSDGYGGDLPTGVEVGSGCRNLDLAAVNAFRRSRNLSDISSVECPKFANLDVRFSKFFSFMQGHRVEFIAQLFNVFDRANLNVPTGGLTSSLFGQPTALLPNINAPSRQVEFAVRYQF
jgi:hypothetical protein